MPTMSCAECEAIRQEALELLAASHKTKPATPCAAQLAAWFDEREEDQEGRTTRTLALKTMMQRAMEHQKATGHVVEVSLRRDWALSLN